MVKAYQFLKKHGVSISLLAGLIINILMFVTITGGYPAGNPSEDELFNSSAFEFALFSNYTLMFLSVIIALVFAVVQLVRNPKRSAMPMLGALAVILLYVILYSTSAGEVRPEYLRIDPKMPPSTVQIVDASLYVTYIFTFGSIIAMVGIGIYTSVRNR